MKKWDSGRLQVRPQEQGPKTPKCLGGTPDPQSRNQVTGLQIIQVGPGTRDPLSEFGTREPKIKFIIQIKDYTS